MAFRSLPDLLDEALVAVDAFEEEGILPLPKALLTRMGVSYLTNEKPLVGDAILLFSKRFLIYLF
jgi:hypothetical protein